MHKNDRFLIFYFFIDLIINFYLKNNVSNERKYFSVKTKNIHLKNRVFFIKKKYHSSLI